MQSNHWISSNSVSTRAFNLKFQSELYDILSEMFENFEKEFSDDDDDVTISFEALFIL